MPSGDVNGFVWAGIYTEITLAMVESQSSSVAAQAHVFAPEQELAKSTKKLGNA